MANSLTDFATSGFVGLGDLFAKSPLGQAFQNSIAPAAKPVNTNSFSFDFSGAIGKLADLFKPNPVKDATNSLLKTAGTLANQALQGFGNKAIETLLNGNKQPTTVTVSNLTASDPIPSQDSGTLAQLLALLGSTSAQPLTANQIAQQSAQTSLNSVFLIGGIGLIAVLLLVRGK